MNVITNETTMRLTPQVTEQASSTFELFGTDGIRNHIGVFPFTAVGLPIFGYALAQWLRFQYGENPSILMAGDTRSSCGWVKAGLLTGLLRETIHVTNAGILPTPAVNILLKKGAFDCGLMISASHNQFTDNGIKIIDTISGKLSDEQEKSIVAYLRAILEQGEKRVNKEDCFGQEEYFPDAAKMYQEILLKRFDAHCAQGMKIAIDAGNGALSGIAESIFKALGATVYALNIKPDGKNINANCGSLYPQQLQEAVKYYGADVGFAFDGDGDRLTVVNRYGSILDGDHVIALLSTHPAYNNQSTIVGTVVSNQGLANYYSQQNKKFLRVAVGDKNIKCALISQNLLLGGESSGHFILRDYLDSSDGLYTALRLIEIMQSGNHDTLMLFDLLPNISINIPVAKKHNLDESDIGAIIKYHKKWLEQEVQGMLVVRYSGTEPLMRITAQGNSLAVTNNIVQRLIDALSSII